jgi:hypothetical protein
MTDEEMAEQFAEEYQIRKHHQRLYGNKPVVIKELNTTYKDGFLAGLKAGRPQWHDLRKDKNDLPKKEKLGQTFIVAFAFNEQTQKYYSFDCAEYLDKERFITHTIDASKENNAYKVIAWCEIPTFEKESE